MPPDTTIPACADRKKWQNHAKAAKFEPVSAAGRSNRGAARGFYPDDLTQALKETQLREPAPAGDRGQRRITARKRQTFARWAAETPDDFIFTSRGRAMPRTGVSLRERANQISAHSWNQASPNLEESSAPLSGNSRRRKNSTS